MSGNITLLDQPRTLDALARPTSAVISFYLTGTTDLATIYQDAGLTTPAANPVLLSSGQFFPDIFLDPEVSYRRYIVYGDGSIHDVDPLPGGVVSASSVLYTASGTGAVPRTVSERLNDTFSTNDFCAADGVTDDSVELQNALNAAAGGTLYVDEGDILISTTMTVADNTKIIGRGGVIRVATANVSAFNIVSKTGVKFERVKMVSTVAGANPYVAGIVFDTSNYCDVIGCDITGFQWAGVYLASAVKCKIVRNRFGPILGTVNDSADVQVYYDSTDNLVADNQCFGQGWVGINVQDPAGAGTYLPARNVIRGNQITATRALGINVYIGSPGLVCRNSDNIVTENYVEGVTGAANPTGNGTGIYCVGHGLGGLIVSNNRVHNCCTASTGRSNSQAGITVSGFGDNPSFTGTGIAPVVVGNIVTGMTQGDGIAVVTNFAGCVVGPNSVELPATNNGSGVGGGTMIGQALRIADAGRVVVTGGSYVNRGSSDAIVVVAGGYNLTDIIVTGCHIRSTAYGFRVTRSAAFTTSKSVFSNITGVAAAAWSVTALDDSIVSGVSVVTSAAAATETYTSARTTFTGNRLSGTACIFTQGACTGSRFDLSNSLNGNVENAATGLTVMRYGTAAPATGAGAVGDTVINSTPVVGQPKEWKCTVGAYPGTWVSTGNL